MYPQLEIIPVLVWKSEQLAFSCLHVHEVLVRGPLNHLLFLMQINLRINNQLLQDNFEWDINNPLASPEDFSARLCAELNVGTEFVVPIAHAVREQVLQARRVSHRRLFFLYL